jgi:hypothetical protein
MAAPGLCFKLSSCFQADPVTPMMNSDLYLGIQQKIPLQARRKVLVRGMLGECRKPQGGLQGFWRGGNEKTFARSIFVLADSSNESEILP